MSNIDLVNAVFAKDKESFAAAFNAAIANKVSDALDVKKVEIASSFLSQETEVETNEPTEVETEVSGNGDGTVDTSSDAV